MERNVSHVTIQLACTTPREVAFQLQILARALMADAHLTQTKTLAYDYGDGTGHARFSYCLEEPPC